MYQSKGIHARKHLKLNSWKTLRKKGPKRSFFSSKYKKIRTKKASVFEHFSHSESLSNTEALISKSLFFQYIFP